MPRKPQKSKPLTDPAEYQRFLDMAREVEADETPGAIDRALDKVQVVRPMKPVIAEPRRSGKPSGRG
jgi:hypothetical protein